MRRLGFGQRAEGGGVLALYAEAQLAGWVAPPPDLRPPGRPLPPEQADAEALLARFYSCQEC